MGLHAMYDAHRRQKPTQPHCGVWLVTFTDPDTGKPDCYYYHVYDPADRHQADHSAAQLRADGFSDVAVTYRPL
jgi:hypothetical protein